PDNHNHHLQLLRELVANAYLLEEDNREDESQPFGIDYLTYKITGKGVSYCNRALPPDPEVYDGRRIKR
ncbi:MAG: hypothetical protein AAF797_17850, partial [Planctomycetota bacterium]